MAIITANDAEVLTVYPNKGFRAKVTKLDEKGQERITYFKVWGNHNVSVGDNVNVSGDLSTRVEDGVNADGSPKLDREGNQVRYASIHINNAEVEVLGDAPF